MIFSNTFCQLFCCFVLFISNMIPHICNQTTTKVLFSSSCLGTRRPRYYSIKSRNYYTYKKKYIFSSKRPTKAKNILKLASFCVKHKSKPVFSNSHNEIVSVGRQSEIIQIVFKYYNFFFLNLRYPVNSKNTIGRVFATL